MLKHFLWIICISIKNKTHEENIKTRKNERNK